MLLMITREGLAMADLAAPKEMESRDAVTRQIFDTEIRPAGKPVILKGLAADWPATQAAAQSSDAIASYLTGLASDAKVMTYLGKPEMAGRFFYREDMRGFNFERREIAIKKVIAKLLDIREDPSPMHIYAGAGQSAELFPAFAAANPMPLLDAAVTPRVWIGNAARVAPHFDASENIAVALRERRRFLLFPPDQVKNLYIGPFEVTMAGPPASMVDPITPDLERYPKYREAMNHALVADLEPGDAIYIPSLWWHFVQSFESFNVLVNYWWANETAGAGLAAVAHGLLSIRDLPSNEKQAWRALFDHYVFNDEASGAAEHLPEHIQGVLGPSSTERDRKIAAFLIGGLSDI